MIIEKNEISKMFNVFVSFKSVSFKIKSKVAETNIDTI